MTVRSTHAPTLLLVNGTKQAQYATLHEAFAAQRNPPNGSNLICNGNVMARCIGSRWELQTDGISELEWEYENK